MRLRSPRLFVIRYRKREGVSFPDFGFGTFVGAGVMFFVMLFMWESSDRDRDKLEREREEKIRSDLMPTPKVSSKPVYSDEDTVETRYSIEFPSEKRCWTSVVVNPSDRSAMKFQLLMAAANEGAAWNEVKRCSMDYAGGCSRSFVEPWAITTVYTYDVADAKELREACISKKDGAWIFGPKHGTEL